MGAHAHIGLPRSGDLLARLKGYTNRSKLDHQLAAGAVPGASPALARRAQVLRGWRVRHALARGLENAVVEAVWPPRQHGAAIPVQRDAVLAAQHDLLTLAAALRSEPGPDVRAIAIASVLLSDGAGPLLNPRASLLLGEVAFQAAFLAEAD